MSRTTEKQLQAIVSRINRMTGSPESAYTEVGDKFRANIGNFHLSHCYGGVSLHRMTNESGGVSDVLGCGHISKRELAERMYAFIRGYELAQE